MSGPTFTTVRRSRTSCASTSTRSRASTSTTSGPLRPSCAAWSKEERGRRVFVDYNQNAPHKTVFGAWSVRARPGAQVSSPLTWDEVDALHPDELTIPTVPERLAAKGDPWEGMNEQPQ